MVNLESLDHWNGGFKEEKKKRKGLTGSIALLTDLTPKSIFHVVEDTMGRRLLMESLEFPHPLSIISIYMEIYRKRKKFNIFKF